ncbi:MAG: hypothetical protein IKP68_09340 [Clostridia bacterium]|nr:hypothetical protein [Clostridia bacterium]MBR6916602.1 hypothetical protein [Clostridia bacterium]
MHTLIEYLDGIEDDGCRDITHDIIETFINKYSDELMKGHEREYTKEWLEIKIAGRLLFLLWRVFEYDLSQDGERYVFFASDGGNSGISVEAKDPDGNAVPLSVWSEAKAEDILSSCICDDESTRRNITEVISDIIRNTLWKECEL